MLHELGVTLTHTLETHVHADHVTAAWRFQQALGSKIVLSRHGGAAGADVYVDDGDVIEAGTASLIVRSTPGHTDGCVTYVTKDLRMAFTGDALLIRGAGRTDFQQGSAHTALPFDQGADLHAPGRLPASTRATTTPAGR